MMQIGIGKADLLGLAQHYHAPLIALAVALAMTILARMARAGLAAMTAVGVAAAAGWFLLGPRVLTLAPRAPVERLALLAVGVALLTALAGRVWQRSGPWPPLVVAAAAGGWWMAGAPLTHAGLIAALPPGALVAALIVAVGWLLLVPAAETMRAFCVSGTLAAALLVTGAPALWVQMALVLAAAALPPVLWARLPQPALLPAATTTGALGGTFLLAQGQLPRGGFRGADAAGLAPLLALWLMPRIALRLRFAGRFAPFLATLVSGAIAVAGAWAVLRWRGR